MLNGCDDAPLCVHDVHVLQYFFLAICSITRKQKARAIKATMADIIPNWSNANFGLL